MKKLGLLKSKVDSCIYYKINKEDIINLAIYVDDILICTNNMVFFDIHQNLMQMFQMKYLEEAKQILGLRIT